MSNLAQFKGAGLPIGTSIITAAVGDSFTDGSSETWLQSGKGVSPASAPIAALLNHLRVNGIASTGTSVINVTDIASDTTGQYWIATFADATNVYRSADGGATWSTVAHNLTVQAVSVVYANSRFVVSGNDTAAIRTARSTDNGATFTANTTTAITTGTANTARIRYGNSTFVVVATGAGTGAVATSADGTTFTAQNTPIATNAPWLIYVASASLWVISSGTIGNWLTSANCTTGSFTQRTGPFTSGATTSIAANNAIAVAVQSGGAASYFTSTDAITWTSRTPPIAATLQTASVQRVRESEGVFYAAHSGSQIHYSTDGITWTGRWVSATAAQAAICAVANNKLAYVSTTGTQSSVYSANWATCDFVGSTVAVTTTQGDNRAGIVYWRIA